MAIRVSLQRNMCSSAKELQEISCIRALRRSMSIKELIVEN